MAKITNEAGTEIDFDAAAKLMDDDLREQVHASTGDAAVTRQRRSGRIDRRTN